MRAPSFTLSDLFIQCIFNIVPYRTVIQMLCCWATYSIFVMQLESDAGHRDTTLEISLPQGSLGSALDFRGPPRSGKEKGGKGTGFRREGDKESGKGGA